MEQTIDGKRVYYKSKSKNIPSRETIRNTYLGIPQHTSIPIVFETKTEYLKEYVANQEKAHKSKFSNWQVKDYKARERADMGNVVSRYTTKTNPYMRPEEVFFTDKPISKRQFRESAEHEYAHQLWESHPKIRRDWRGINPVNSPTPYGRTDRQEDFAESFMTGKEGRPLDQHRARILRKDLRSFNDTNYGTGWGVQPQSSFLPLHDPSVISLHGGASSGDSPYDTSSSIIGLIKRSPSNFSVVRNDRRINTNDPRYDNHRFLIHELTTGDPQRESIALSHLNRQTGMNNYFDNKDREGNPSRDNSSQNQCIGPIVGSGLNILALGAMTEAASHIMDSAQHKKHVNRYGHSDRLLKNFKR